LPSKLCRARPHGKGFAEPIIAFAVQFGRTAKPCFPVVIGTTSFHFIAQPNTNDIQVRKQSIRFHFMTSSIFSPNLV
jgi:hypothetical protein